MEIKNKEQEDRNKLLDQAGVLNKIIYSDVIDGLRMVPDNTVSLVFTSCPYNVDIKYGSHNDALSFPVYLDWLKGVWSECKRVLRPGGRLAINIDTVRNVDDDSEYLHPIGYYLTKQAKEIGLLPFTEIVWYKQNASGRKTAWGCYDKFTRVVTKNGLKYFKDVTYQDEIATLNMQTMEMEYQNPISIIEYKYEGNMYRIKSRSFDLLVTPDHNMFYKKSSGELGLRKIKEMPKCFCIPQGHNGIKFNYEEKKYFYLPVISYGKRSRKSYINKNTIKIDMKDWIMFLGIYLTDGSVYYDERRGSYTTSIYQSKKTYLQEIKDLLHRLPFNFKYKENKKEYYTCSKQLASFLNGFSKKNEREIPNFIMQCTIPQKKLFIEWLVKGDGSIARNGSIRLYIASEAFVKKIIVLLSECGYAFSHSIRKKQKPKLVKTGKLAGRIMNCNIRLQEIKIKISNNYYIRENENISQEKYSGMVYCLELNNHVMFVERNGKFTWCGNSWCSSSLPNIRRVHEYIYVFSKDQFRLDGDSELSDMEAEEFEQWTLSTWFICPETKNMGGHPASFPEELVRRAIKLWTYRGDIVLDPFVGSGTTACVANRLMRKYVGIDNCLEYVKYARDRINSSPDMFEEDYVPRSERLAIRKKARMVENEENGIDTIDGA